METGDSRQRKFIIWVDADACPRAARDLIQRTAVRRNVRTQFVANAPQYVPPHPQIGFTLVAAGPDKADDHLVEQATPDDVVVTGDIPLAARLVEKGILVLDHRGEELTSATIGDRLAMRDLLEGLRANGQNVGGPREYGQADLQRFANALDRFITRRSRAP